MKNLIGFQASPEELTKTEPQTLIPAQPVRSIVAVRFEKDGKRLTYYNDRFALEPGDAVYVSGTMAGVLGTVESVSTKFKINLSAYQTVLAKLDRSIRGSYRSCIDKMVSTDANALSPAQFRSWVIAPREEEEEIVVGDGYELELEALEDAQEVTHEILERALQYCCEGRVKYLSVENGNAVAYVEGSEWYELNFRVDGGTIRELYCDCPYPGLCKHALAALLTLRALYKAEPSLDGVYSLTAVDRVLFWKTVACSTKEITL